jgi:hypothetical protein
MSDRPVWIDTPTARVVTRTTADGSFRLAGVPSGRWTVRFDAGPNLTAEAAIELDSTDDCYDVRPMINPAGGLAGSVVDESGMPVVSAPIAAILATDTEGIHEFHGETDDNGQFTIPALAPGPYLLRVGIDGGANGHAPYRPLFYPAAEERSSAKVLEVGVSTIRLDPIVMRASLPTVTLEVDIVCGDGARPPKAFLAAERMDGHGQTDSSSVQEGVGPRFLRVLAGHRYTVQGMVEVRRKKPDGATEIVVTPTAVLQVDADAGPKVLRIRADLQGCDAPGGIWIAPR